MLKKILIFFVFMFIVSGHTAFAADATSTTGAIEGDHKYAWGENIGWINFGPNATTTNDYVGVVVTDTALSGYAWSGTYGWINFNPTNSGQGVLNTTGGTLSGYAWSSSLGWINMAGVTINSQGKFSGVAGVSNSNAGRISFDCTSCDVVTSWRPTISVPEPAPDTSHSGGHVTVTNSLTEVKPNTPQTIEISSKPIENINRILETISLPRVENVAFNIPKDAIASIPDHVESYNEVLNVLPFQKGTFVSESLGGGSQVAAIVNIPRNVLGDDSISISIDQKKVKNMQAISPTQYATLAAGTIFDITAKNSKGESVHAFNKPVIISLAIPDLLQGYKDLNVYYYNEEQKHWVYVPAVFSLKTATFAVSHLTKFAILKNIDLQANAFVSKYDYFNNSFFWWSILLLILFIILLWEIVRQRKKHERFFKPY